MPVNLGERVRKVSVSRSDVGEGVKGRCVLIDPRPRATYIAYDNANRFAVYVDQEAIIKHKLNARTNYLFLVARLNTDMKGNAIGHDFVVEYLKLSDQLYDEFSDAVEELGGEESLQSIVLKKEVKRQGQQDYSYLKPTASKQAVDQEIWDAIAKLDVEALWKLVEADAARSLEEYEKMLAEKAGTGGDFKEIAANAQGSANLGTGRRTKAAINAPSSTESNPSDSFDSDDDDEFSEDK